MTKARKYDKGAKVVIRTAVTLGVSTLTLIAPGLPWSLKLHHSITRVVSLTFKDSDGRVASYKELRLDTNLLGDASLPEHKSNSVTLGGLKCAPFYESGICHYYLFTEQ